MKLGHFAVVQNDLILFITVWKREIGPLSIFTAILRKNIFFYFSACFTPFFLSKYNNTTVFSLSRQQTELNKIKKENGKKGKQIEAAN